MILVGRRLIPLVVVAATMFICPTASLAGDNYAAILRVTASGVQIKRLDTINWAELPLDSESPVGAGDTIQTDSDGRAIIHFEEGIELLLLPGSNYSIIKFSQLDDGRWQLGASIDGRLIQHVTDPSQVGSYTLETSFFTVIEPSIRFAVQTRASGVGSIVSAGGEVILTAGDQEVAVPANHGFRISDTDRSITSLTKPANFALLDSMLDGCPGTVNTGLRADLNVRTQLGVHYYVMGTIENDQEVQIMGQRNSDFGIWYRIQFLGDFGWVTADSVETECQRLPVIENTAPDYPAGLSRVSADEMALLDSFYGSPADNIWIYRSTR